MHSIYSKADEPVLKFFEQIKDSSKLLCVALDYAKSKHTVLFCNGAGEILKKSFAVENAAAGLEELLQQVQATCHHRGIPLKHVFFGGEDRPGYAANFCAALIGKKFLVVRISAAEAKKARQNSKASSDLLDLQGIAHCLLQRTGRLVAVQNEAYTHLRILVRERDYLVAWQTALTNHLYPYADQLFPGFLDAHSAVTPFGPACWWLLEKDFSAPQIARRASQRLVQGLTKLHVHQPLKVAEELQEQARHVLVPVAEKIKPSQIALTQLVPIHHCLAQAVAGLDREVAMVLARTPAAVLTSLPGIGVTLAAGLGAETGVLHKMPSLDGLACYAGLVPRSDQTGGPDQPPVLGHKSHKVNKRLKHYLMSGGEHIARIPGSQAQLLAQRAEEKKQHVLVVLAKHLAGLMRSLLLRQTIYLPPELFAKDSSASSRAEYYQQLWPKWLDKWKRSQADVSQVFAPTNPLGQWRTMVQKLHKISLPLPGSAQSSKVCVTTEESPTL